MENEIVLAQRAMMAAEIESQITTAKAYPRDIRVFKDKLMAMANLDQETAESCYYSLPRGDKAIDGPSVRLAEIALSCYGNCVAEAFVENIDESFVHTVGMCRDLENNVAVKIRNSRRIRKADSHVCAKCKKWHKFMPNDGKCVKCKEGDVVFKRGDRYNDDMISTTSNASCAIAFRNSVFKIVPGAYIKPVFDRVKATAVGDVKSLVARRSEVMGKIMQFGVTEDRILASLKRKSIDEVTFDNLAHLIGIGTAIKDGETVVEDAFPILSFKETQSVATKDNSDISGSQAADVKSAKTKGEAPEPTGTEDWETA